MCIVSLPAMTLVADQNVLKPVIGRVRLLIARCRQRWLLAGTVSSRPPQEADFAFDGPGTAKVRLQRPEGKTGLGHDRSYKRSKDRVTTDRFARHSRGSPLSVPGGVVSHAVVQRVWRPGTHRSGSEVIRAQKADLTSARHWHSAARSDVWNGRLSHRRRRPACRSLACGHRFVTVGPSLAWAETNWPMPVSCRYGNRSCLNDSPSVTARQPASYRVNASASTLLSMTFRNSAL
jgi:hypothetical protein